MPPAISKFHDAASRALSLASRGGKSCKIRIATPNQSSRRGTLAFGDQKLSRMPPKKSVNWKLWAKVLVGGVAISVGGPALTYWLVPTEEELRSRYNPELQKKSLEGREERQQEFDEFVTKLKEYSKSDKPIWVVVKEEEEKRKKAEIEASKLQQKEAEARREEMRREAGLVGK